MDFSVAGSDLWETTAAQEKFIQNYFQEQKISTSPSKTLKKKRKILQSFDDEHHQFKGKIPRKKTKLKIVEVNETEDLEQNSESSFPESDKKDVISKVKKFQKKKLKQSLKKAVDFSEDQEKVNETEDLEQNSESSFPEPDKKDVLSKVKKFQKKKLKQSSKKDVELSEDQDLKQNAKDSSSESVEELTRDIKNSEIYKEIQEFLKQSPSLSNLKGYSNEPSEEDSNNSSGESSIEDFNDLSSEVVSATKTKNETRNVKENTKNTTSSSKLRICNSNDKDMLSKNLESLKKQGNSNLLAQNVNSKNKTVASTLKNKAQVKLQAAKFRYLNEKFYTETGRCAVQYFQENVEEFHDYHMGYSLQVAKWPINPVNKIISELQELKENAVIADLGCGDAKIARTLTNVTVHSFDMVALNECVTACDISKVPLANESVDVVVFCLSLMGTNFKEYLIESNRILKMGGLLKIAEVESRIEDVNIFVKGLKCLGFSLLKKDEKHKIFVFLDLKKVKKGLKKAKIPSLRPCLYKKR